MIKSELEKYTQRIEQELHTYKELIGNIEREIEKCAYLKRNGLSDECDYNDGFCTALDFFIKIINQYKTRKIEPIQKDFKGKLIKFEPKGEQSDEDKSKFIYFDENWQPHELKQAIS